MTNNSSSIAKVEAERAFVQYRVFPGHNELYSALSARAHSGEITDEEVVRRMKLAEADYYGDGPRVEGGEKKRLTEGR
jgi:hypothetical protein